MRDLTSRRCGIHGKIMPTCGSCENKICKDCTPNHLEECFK